jgi:hypothetical protein
VADLADSVFLGSGSLFTGQLVKYETSGTAIGGLVSGNYYTVIRAANGASIQLAAADGSLINLDPSVSAAATVHTLTAAQHVVGVAGTDIDLDLKAVLRSDAVLPASGFTATIDSLTAGRTINLLLQDSAQQTGAAGSSGVRVTTLQETANYDYITNPPADGTRDWRFTSFFRQIDSAAGAFGGTEAARNSVYDFRNLDTSGNRTLAGLIAGKTATGDIVVNDVQGLADTTVNGAGGLAQPTISVLGRSNLIGTGHIDTNVDGSVTLTENTGDLRVGLIRSRGSDVTLTAQDASIVDAKTNDGAAPVGDSAPDVVGVNITLLATLGSIGSDANFLEIDSSNLNGGVGNGLLDARARDNIRITETKGDLRLKIVDSAVGDVSLVTLTGSILDGRAGAGLQTDAAVVLANSIDLQANGGSIGQSSGNGGDIEIDSSRQATGDVGLEARDNIYVTEVDGTLRLVQARRARRSTPPPPAAATST